MEGSHSPTLVKDICMHWNGKVQMNTFPHWDFALQVSVHAVRWNGSQDFLIQLLSREVIHLIFNKTRKDFRTGLFLFYYQCSLLLSKFSLGYHGLRLSRNSKQILSFLILRRVIASCWNSGWTGHFLCHKAMTVNLLLHWIGLRLLRKSGDTFKPFPHLFKVDRLQMIVVAKK